MTTLPRTAHLARPAGRVLLAELCVMALASVVVRLGFAIGFCLLTGSTYPELLRSGDGVSYIAYAEFITGQAASLGEYDSRVFPGLPLLMAGLAALGIPAIAAGAFWNLAASAVVPPLAAAVFDSRRLGWSLVLLTPTFVACGAAIGTETPVLALTLGGLLVALRQPGVAGAVFAGVLLGLAGTVRPMACFAVAGLLVVQLLQGRRLAAGVVAVVSLAVVGLALLAVEFWLGDALRSARVYAQHQEAYAGELFAWPGKSLLFTPLYQPISPAKVAYVWLHVAALVGAFVLLGLRWRRERQAVALAGIWLAGNTLFALVVGSDWGFHIFPRLVIPALPALLWAYRPLLPAFGWLWLLLAAVALPAAVLHVAV